MINKDELTAIYSEFFNATIKNPLVYFPRACFALGVPEEEATRVIKNYLFGNSTNTFTNPTGFKLLHIYAIEKESAMNMFTDRFVANTENGKLVLPREKFTEIIDKSLKGEN